jgi:Flp pilus assembly protein TadG
MNVSAHSKSVRANRRERGDTFIELALVLLPLMALMLAIIDFSMPIFLKSTFSAAVREGCRFGITYNLTFNGTTYTSQTAAIKAVVQNYSMGFLSGTGGANYIAVKYYSPVSPYGELTGQAGANNGGNILEVSVNNYSFTPIAPIWRSGNPFSISAISSDRLETLPAGTTPPAQ